MSQMIQWIAFFLFLILFAAAVWAEIAWITRKGWATSGRSTGYVFASNAAGFLIGAVFVLAVLMILLMMTFGSAGRGSTIPEPAYWITLAAGLIFPPIALVLSKRIFLSVFSIRSGVNAWTYSIVASISILVVVLVLPPAFFVLAGYLTQWK